MCSSDLFEFFGNTEGHMIHSHHNMYLHLKISSNHSKNVILKRKPKVRKITKTETEGDPEGAGGPLGHAWWAPGRPGHRLSSPLCLFIPFNPKKFGDGVICHESHKEVPSPRKSNLGLL